MVRMGINRAEVGQRALLEKSSFSNEERCIFLSHASKDKEAVREIGNYIMNSGIDIYLDENDIDLQTAAEAGNHNEVTSCIEKGINKSTDIFCIVSEETKKSWWVPYEVGYGKKAKTNLYTFLLRDVTHIPSYLKICGIIKDRWDLNSVLGDLSKGELLKESSTFDYNYNQRAGSIVNYDAANHPLNEYVREIRHD
ncbi:toll/interleukin-1 receptor domain-containing protein [Planococcus alpniumensis]|uniref:toll/interleukin-1 receptor domain-containing protein n=1 Tax=Planococcus alpniumensis TaxID=2708345 RepID=UPI001B8BA3B6|nr:toll/interleukin-1 receptor domain-containing protein [Planococcus sp. MSAK28401]